MPNPVVHFEITGREAERLPAERLGGKRLAGPMEVPGGPTLALFADPEDHTIGLVAAAG